jgi:iron complex transport system substrate-binding protein
MIKIKKYCVFCIILVGLLWLGGCGGPSENAEGAEKENTEENTGILQEQKQTSLIYEGSMELSYAENFTVDYYEGGYIMLTTTMDGNRFLVVPEGKDIPFDMEEDIVVINRPVENLYLVASSVMDMIDELGALDTISFSGQKAEGWYIDGAREAMENGNILYAGKYSMPDYELLVSKGCSLAIENTMINHSPEVIEKLESFGIPVLIEYSSYESHPLGRVEWIKFFGALLGKEEEADKIFNEQSEILSRITDGNQYYTENEDTLPTVAFFYITSNGLAQVRRSSDYIPKMIELAGGKYIFDTIGDGESKKSTINMQIEEFYNGAKDADYIIYNSSIDGGVDNIDELIEKCSLLADFNAVKQGNVWCTTNDMYQQSLSIGYLMQDIYTMLNGGDEDEMRYLYRLY